MKSSSCEFTQIVSEFPQSSPVHRLKLVYCPSGLLRYVAIAVSHVVELPNQFPLLLAQTLQSLLNSGLQDTNVMGLFGSDGGQYRQGWVPPDINDPILVNDSTVGHGVSLFST